MVETHLYTHQMASPCSSKRIGVAIALCVLLLIHWSFYSRDPLTSTLLTFLLLVLSTSLPLFLPSIGQQIKLDSASLPRDEVFEDEKATTGGAVTENSSQTVSQCFKSDEEPPAEDAYDSIENSEGSISDDENLIEISLPDGHFVVPEEPKPMLKPLQLPADIRRGVAMTNFLPESVVRQHGLMELLSEINEEDNLIEIDIARGSIKCSRVGILA